MSDISPIFNTMKHCVSDISPMFGPTARLFAVSGDVERQNT